MQEIYSKRVEYEATAGIVTTVITDTKINKVCYGKITVEIKIVLLRDGTRREITDITKLEKCYAESEKDFEFIRRLALNRRRKMLEEFEHLNLKKVDDKNE